MADKHRVTEETNSPTAKRAKASPLPFASSIQMKSACRRRGNLKMNKGGTGKQSRPQSTGKHGFNSSSPFSIRHKDFTANFFLSHHACIRMRERGLDYQKVRTAVVRVRHLLKNPAGRNAKVVIPEYSKGCALLVKFNGCQATVITILTYPDMVLPAGVEILDWRAGLS